MEPEVRVVGDRVTVCHDGKSLVTAPLADVVAAIVRAGQRLPSCGVLPEDVRIWRERRGATAVAIEVPAHARTVRWIADDSPVPFGPATRYRDCFLAFPYVVLLVVFRGAQLTGFQQLYYRREPLTAEGDDALLLPNLYNVAEAYEQRCLGVPPQQLRRRSARSWPELRGGGHRPRVPPRRSIAARKSTRATRTGGGCARSIRARRVGRRVGARDPRRSLVRARRVVAARRRHRPRRATRDARSGRRTRAREADRDRPGRGDHRRHRRAGADVKFPVILKTGPEVRDPARLYYEVAANGVFQVKETAHPSRGDARRARHPRAPAERERAAPSCAAAAAPPRCLADVLAFFREVNDRWEAEAIVILFHRPDTGEYRVGVPEQRIPCYRDWEGRWRTYLELDYGDAPRPEGFVRFGTVHSHANPARLRERRGLPRRALPGGTPRRVWPPRPARAVARRVVRGERRALPRSTRCRCSRRARCPERPARRDWLARVALRPHRSVVGPRLVELAMSGSARQRYVVIGLGGIGGLVAAAVGALPHRNGAARRWSRSTATLTRSATARA